MRSRGYLEIATHGRSSWMPCATQGVKGTDDGDGDDDDNYDDDNHDDDNDDYGDNNDDDDDDDAYRRRGRPKRTWRRTIEDEIRNTGRSWNEVKGIAGDRKAWKLFMDALCSKRSERTR